MYARVINPGEAREGRSGWLAGLFGLANGGSEQLLAVRASFLSPRCQGLPRGSCTPRQYCHAVPSPTYIITYPRPQQPPTAPAPSHRPRGPGPSTARRCAPECGQAYYEPESDPAQGRPQRACGGGTVRGSARARAPGQIWALCLRMDLSRVMTRAPWRHGGARSAVTASDSRPRYTGRRPP